MAADEETFVRGKVVGNCVYHVLFTVFNYGYFVNEN